MPVLAGSTAYAIGESRKWPVGLSRKPNQAMACYGVLALSVTLGMALNFTSIDPIKALYWSAVINGVLAAPVMVMRNAGASAQSDGRTGGDRLALWIGLGVDRSNGPLHLRHGYDSVHLSGHWT